MPAPAGKSRPYIARFVAEGASTHEQFDAFDAARSAGTLIIPSVESRLGIEQVDEILETPGLRAFGIAMTDLAIALGHPMQYDHPDVWHFVDRVAQQARARGIWLTAGTGYADRTWDGIAERARRLHDHGVHMIFLQTPEYVLQLATTQLLGRVRDALAR